MRSALHRSKKGIVQCRLSQPRKDTHFENNHFPEVPTRPPTPEPGVYRLDMCIRWRLSVLAERFAGHRLSERGKIAKLHLPLPPTELRVSQNNFHSHSVDETETTFVQAKSVVPGPRHHNSISYFALTFQRALLCITKSPIIFRNCQEHRLKILTSTAIFYAPAPPQSDGIVVS